MDSKRIQLLVEKFIENSATSADEAELMDWYRSANEQDLEWLSENADESELTRLRMLAAIHQQIGHTPARRLAWRWVAAAASVLLIVSAGGYFLLHKQQPQQQITQNKPVNIKPGTKKAILQLANGQQIALNEAPTGTLARQGNATVTKTADGQVTYKAENSANTTEDIYNTITTQRGGYYPLKMADGTIAILDAASSIRYPVTFNGRERRVEITGQVYFIVAHNASKPFRVTVKDQTIEDIGTEFNINAYDDEPYLRTTLVEGAVKVSKQNLSVLLKPGQQALTQSELNNILVRAVDADDVVAWKNGQTSFKNEDIREIMRQVSRWYDVDIQYQGNLPDRKFVGGISRNASLSDLLKILEFNNIHFTVEGKKIIVRP